jgi:hypothetical protein
MLYNTNTICSLEIIVEMPPVGPHLGCLRLRHKQRQLAKIPVFFQVLCPFSEHSEFLLFLCFGFVCRDVNAASLCLTQLCYVTVC